MRKALAIGLFAAAAAVMAEETSVPLSPFRKYFWGARQAYEQRDFKEAERLLRAYRKLGSPSDRMLKLAGCDPLWEVDVFSAALKESHACLSRRSKSAFWTDADRAKFIIRMALRTGNAAPLEPYVDCASADLVPQATTCGTHFYRKPSDLNRLAAVLQKTPDILEKSNWRQLPVQPNDPQNIRWVLYTDSDQWKPCAMPNSPIISLRQDPTGELRIAGFAVSCLEAQP
jgi:hypothetical protein